MFASYDAVYILGDLEAAPVLHSSTNDEGFISYAPIALSDWFKTDEDQLFPMTAIQPNLVPASIGALASSSKEQAIAFTQATPSDLEPSAEASPPVSATVEAILSFCYVCRWSQCSRGFSSSERLDEHVTTHTKNTKSDASCQWIQCNERRVSRWLLNKHLKTHTKPFQCTEPSCNHSVATSRDLQRHLRTHGTKIGDKFFSCPYADCEHSQNGDKAPFKRLDHAKRHLLRKHPHLTQSPIPIFI